MRISDWSSDVCSSDLFVEKLTTQPLRARFHTYRELLLGVHLRQRGANFRYEQLICEKTPDWSLRSEESQLLEVIDVVTLHQRNAKEQEISTSIRSSSRWAGWIGIPPDHIYRKLSDKRSEEHTSELQSLMRISYAVFCLKKK